MKPLFTRSPRKIAILLLAVLGLAPLTESLLFVRTVWGTNRLSRDETDPSSCCSSKTSCCGSEEETLPRLLEIPQEELARRAWISKFGERFGIDESMDVEVVCTCTCCGDRCPMGASCCCLAPKYPVIRDTLFALCGPGCSSDPADPLYSPTFLHWVSILNRPRETAHPLREAAPPRLNIRMLDSTLQPETPPPRLPSPLS